MSMGKLVNIGAVGRALLLALTLAVLSGCGPIQSTPAISEAERAIAAASAASAEDSAVYQFVLAQEYLQKAREEWARARYQKASRYAELAASYADEAQRRAAMVREGAAPDTAPTQTSTEQ